MTRNELGPSPTHRPLKQPCVPPKIITGDRTMYIARRAIVFVEGFLASYAPSFVKKRLWDRDFAGGKWDFIDDTAGDCVYAHLEKHTKGGDILDLGCGPGNTANELAADAYRHYIGVDISEVALEKARKRTRQEGREGKNSFVCSDFLGYAPAQDFDVLESRQYEKPGAPTIVVFQPRR